MRGNYFCKLSNRILSERSNPQALLDGLLHSEFIRPLPDVWRNFFFFFFF